MWANYINWFKLKINSFTYIFKITKKKKITSRFYALWSTFDFDNLFDPDLFYFSCRNIEYVPATKKNNKSGSNKLSKSKVDRNSNPAGLFYLSM